MKFKKITIENFKSVGPKPVVIDFNFNDIKLLLGKNGTGKSTIFDAVTWCIYNFTNLKADNVVNKYVPPGLGTKVEIEFSEKGHDYVITRYRRHKEHKNNVYIFRDKVSMTRKGSKENQEYINSIIGIEQKAFISSIILSSETYKDFLREDYSSRLQIFESIFSLNEINYYVKALRKKISASKESLNEVNSSIEKFTYSIKSHASILENYKAEKKEECDRAKATAKALKDEIENLNKKINELEKIDTKKELSLIEKHDKNSFENNIKLEELSRLKKNIKSLNDDLDRKNLEREELTTLIDKLSSVDYEKEIKRIKLFEKVKIIIEKQKTKSNDLLTEISGLKIKSNELKNKVSSYTKSIKKLESEISEIKQHKSTCPLCGGEIDKEIHDKIIKEKSDEKKEKEKEFEEITVEYDKLKKEIVDNNDKYNVLEKEIHKFDAIDKPLHAEEFYAEIPSKLEVAKRKLSGILSPINQLENDIKKNVENANSLSEYIKKNKVSSSSIYNKDYLYDIDKTIAEKLTNKAVAESKLREAVEKTKAKVDTEYDTKLILLIKKEKEKISSDTKNKKEIEQELKYWNAFSEIFSNGENGFKKYFIKSIVGIFNDKINMFLPFFFEKDITINFDKNLRETIKYNNKDAEFSELSSGEKTRCELCIIFSLFFMVRELFGSETNIFVLDEILDRNLDNEGVEAVIKIIEDISKDTSVFVISHRDEYKERFNKVLKIKKDDDGFTIIE